MPCFEPCAGEGAIVAAANEFYGSLFTPEWTAMEIREDALPVLATHVPEKDIHIDNYLTQLAGEWTPSLVISNPPFSIAYEVIQRSLHYKGADVIMLLRLNFLASATRNRFMKDFPPDIYVLPNRPDFKAHGKTDSIEYAWYHWPAGKRRRSHGNVQVLDETPLAERRENFTAILHPSCAGGDHRLVLDPKDGLCCERAGCGYIDGGQ